MNVLARLAADLGRHRLWALGGAVAAMVLAGATAAYPVALERLTARMLGASPAALPHDDGRWAAWVDAHLVPLFVGLVLIKGAAQAGRVYSWGRATQALVRALRGQAYGRLVQQSPIFFSTRRVGDVAARTGSDVDEVERAVGQGLPVLVGDTVKLAALAVVVVVMYPGVLRVALVVLGLALAPIVLFGRLLKRYARASQEAKGELTQQVVQTVQGIGVVQAFDAVDAEQRRFQRAQGRYLRAVTRMLAVRAVHSPLMEMLGVAALLATLHVAAGRGSALAPSEAVGFMLAVVLMYEPLKNIARINGVLMPGISAAQRLYELIDAQPAVVEPDLPRRWARPPTTARFERVSFRYADSEPAVLTELDLRLDVGRVVALVGASGSGKTTVAGFLPRLYDPTAGRVCMGDRDLRTLPLADIRAQVAMVSQDTFLFNASIGDNVAYGSPGAEPVAVQRAAERAGVAELIESFPRGWDTPCGDRGVRLSGGQRQRVAIARAFLKDAPFLVLDEATSALDPEQATAIHGALRRLMANRAVLLISHEPTVVALASEAIVLDGGRVVDRGPPSAVWPRRRAPT